MNKNKITILVIPDRSKKKLTLQLFESHIKCAFFVLIILFAVFSAMIVDYLHLLPQKSINRELKSEKKDVIEKIQIVAGRMNSAETELERVGKFSVKLKTITSIYQPDRGLVLPMGPMALSNKEIEEKIKLAEGEGAPSFRPVLDVPLFKEKMLDEITDDVPNAASEAERSGLSKRLDRLLSISQLREREALTLWEDLQDRSALLSATPSSKPANGRYSSGFGYRLSPYTEKPLMHEGIDIAAPYGSPVYAPADGTVTFSGYNGGYGKLVIVDHGYGVETRFGHNSQLHVRVGQNVRRGDLISSIGSTGRSTGPHVHYEVRVRGEPVDPMNYILDE